MKQLNIAICDDDKNCIDDLLYHLKQYDWYIVPQIITYLKIDDLIYSIKSGQIFDLVFLDIQFDGNAQGTDMGPMIKTLSPKTLIIYISAYDYLKELANAEPFAFVPKPIDQQFLFTKLKKAIFRLSYLKMDYTFQFISGRKPRIVYLNDVICFKSDYRIIKVYLENGDTYDFYGKLDDVEYKVSHFYNDLIRINRSYLINYTYIQSINLIDYVIELKNGMTIGITKNYQDNFIKKYSELHLFI